MTVWYFFLHSSISICWISPGLGIQSFYYTSGFCLLVFCWFLPLYSKRILVRGFGIRAICWPHRMTPKSQGESEKHWRELFKCLVGCACAGIRSRAFWFLIESLTGSISRFFMIFLAGFVLLVICPFHLVYPTYWLIFMVFCTFCFCRIRSNVPTFISNFSNLSLVFFLV